MMRGELNQANAGVFSERFPSICAAALSITFHAAIVQIDNHKSLVLNFLVENHSGINIHKSNIVKENVTPA